MATKRQTPSADEHNKTFVLTFAEVAKLLNQVTLARFITDLTVAIIEAYDDSDLDSMTRTGWPRPPDTLEVMGCQGRDYTSVKIISSNPSLTDPGIPIVTGTLVCTEAGSDQARLVCDASIITPLRTAASTAVVMRELVPHVETLGIIGAGREGASHGFVLSAMLSGVKNVVLYDSITERARLAAEEVSKLLGRSDMASLVQGRTISIVSLEEAERARVFECDALVTATYGQTSVVSPRDVEANKISFIAAVGADLEGKRELDVTVYDDAKFIADDLLQCLYDGELQSAAPRLRVTKPPHSRGNNAASLSGGRFISVASLLRDPTSFKKRREKLTIYDSTGFSGQDLALARVLLQMLEEQGWESRAWNPPETRSLVDVLQTYK